MIDQLIEHAALSPSPRFNVVVVPWGGAIDRPPARAGAFDQRHVSFITQIMTCWSDPDDDDRHVTWARRCAAALRPHAIGSGYLNFLEDDTDTTVDNAFSPATYQRLRAIKRRYDPDNLFHHNHNVPPATDAR